MMHIKLFEYFKEDLKKFSEESLAYLLDDETFSLKIEKNKLYRVSDIKYNNSYYKTNYMPRSVLAKQRSVTQEVSNVDNRRRDTIILERGKYEMRRSTYGNNNLYIPMNFTWDSVKENMIPFIEILDSKYGVRDIIFIGKDNIIKGVRKDRMENFDFEIKRMFIIIKN